MNYYRIIAIACLANLVISCDRIEGKAKDFASDTVKNIKSTSRDILVSDLQKNAEALCINVFTTGSLKPEPTLYQNYAISASFVLGKDYPIDLKVYGDGKYQIAVPLFRQDGTQGLFTGRCNVENGIVMEKKLFAPA